MKINNKLNNGANIHRKSQTCHQKRRIFLFHSSPHEQSVPQIGHWRSRSQYRSHEAGHPHPVVLKSHDIVIRDKQKIDW